MKISKETIKRALRTFVQAAIGYAAVNIVAVDFSSSEKPVKSALLGLAASAISAGMAAAMNIEHCKKDDKEE